MRKYYFMWWLLITFFLDDAVRLANYIVFYFRKVGPDADIRDFILVLAGGNLENRKALRKLALEELWRGE